MSISYDYTYSVATYFSGGINADQLSYSIRNSLGTFQSLYVENDTVHILFSASLSAGNLITLNNIITAYTYSGEMYDELSKIVIAPAIAYTITSSNAYVRIATLRYPGALYKNLSKIVVRSAIDLALSYNIKLATDGGSTIYESSNQSNSTISTIEFTSGFSNIPVTETYCHLWVKINGIIMTQNVYVEYFAIHLT